jgi:hypothetical protein
LFLDEHQLVLRVPAQIKGRLLLSGYPSELYASYG